MKYDLIVIGSGPAGYVGAIRAGQTGLKTLVIDRKYIGGMCLNWGCIPSKTWLESAKLYQKVKHASDFGITGIDPESIGFDWKAVQKRSAGVVAKLTRGIEYLWKQAGVEFLEAEAKIVSPREVQAAGKLYEAEYIMIATGSKPAVAQGLPPMISLEELPTLDQLPEAPVIYGMGGVALEMAQFFDLIGKKPVIVSTSERLIPNLDDALLAFITKRLKKSKIPGLPAAETLLKDAVATYGKDSYSYDAILNCSRREAILPPADIAITLRDGYIDTDGQLRTNHPNIFAAGDVNGISYLAHAASAQALRIIDTIHGRAPLDVEPLYPVNIYSDPEIAQIGVIERDLKARGIEYKTSEYQLSANGKALAEGNSDGFLRLIYEPKYSQVLGVQIVSANATDMISEAAILMELEGTVYDLANAVHAHPTVSEVFMDAGAKAENN
jgi:dihydrolipoamide dehydrogenase